MKSPVNGQRLLDLVLRTDFRAFLQKCVMTLDPGSTYLHNWHIDAITFELGRIQSGANNRLIINMPPRYLKSITVSVAFSAYVLGLDPRRRIFGVSYGEDLAKKHAADVRCYR